jgi:hypothetical protein
MSILAIVMLLSLVMTMPNSVEAASKYTISGAVVLGGGNSPPGKVAILVILNGPVSRTASSAGTGGTFSFPNLPAGTYTLRVNPPAGYIVIGGSSRTVTIGPNKSVQFALIKQTTPTPTPTPTPSPTPPAYTCGNSTTTPGILQPNDTFTTTVNTNYTGTPPANLAFRISVVGTNPDYTNNNATPLTITSSSLSFTTGSLLAPAAATTFTVSWQLYSGATAIGLPCAGQIKTVNLPYFSVYGSDVNAGGEFNSCTSSGGTLAGWYDSETAHAGASTLFAAIALGKTYGFASGQNTTSGSPTNSSSNGLTFANTSAGSGTSPDAGLGGDFGSMNCLFTPTSPAFTTSDGSATMNIGSDPLDDGSHSYTGNVQLNGGTVPLGKNVGLYVGGNVYITSNIIYGTEPGGVWTINPDETSSVPSFTLEVTGGNIYVAPGVTELDGIFVAEAVNGHGGTIYTCGQDSGGSFVPMAAANLYSSCNGQLSIYGSFIADQVNLMRTFGTLKDATSTESPEGSSRTCTNGNSEPVCASEIFDFSPELYLSNPQIQLTNNGDPSYDSVTSLPPVL